MSGAASTTQLWPFTSPPSMAPDEKQRWGDTCRIKTSVDDLFADPSRSAVVMTHAGNGATTSHALLPDYRLLSFSYNPDQWPGQPHAFTKSDDHFSQWMAQIAYAITGMLREESQMLERLSIQNVEFISWLMQRYVGRRPSDSWLSYIESQLAADRWQRLSAQMSANSSDSLYEDTVSDLYGQIDEALDIARRIGYKGIYASIDISWSDWIGRSQDERAQMMLGVHQLLTELSPLQKSGFGMKMSLPWSLIPIHEVRQMVRGRATVTAYEWDADSLARIAGNLITLASDGALDGAELLPTATWEAIFADLTSIWGARGPEAAVATARAALELIDEKTPPEERTQKLRYKLYRHSAPLRLDHDRTRRTVWRGATPIALDEAPFRLFEILWQHHGEFVSNEALMIEARTKHNLDKNISRIREEIEPLFAQRDYLYLKRTISDGTWLDKAVCHFS